MTPRGLAARVASICARHPWPIVVLFVALACVSAWSVARLEVQPVEDALLDRGSKAWQETARSERLFGSDPVVVVVEGDLNRTLEPDGLDRLGVLETCLAGRIGQGRGSLFELCRQLFELDPVEVFTGPATFLGQAVSGIGQVYRQQLRRLRELPRGPGRAEERQALLQQLAQTAVRYGLFSSPSLRNRDFVNRIVFGPDGVGGGPKPRLSYLFPSPDSAQVVMRLRDDLTAPERDRVISLIREVADHPDTSVPGARYVVSGSPVVFAGLDRPVRSGLAIVVAVALLLMAVALSLVFGSTWRLLPLLVAVVSVLIVGGLLALAGRPLSLAALAAAPILVGLTVDYAVQLQSRFDELAGTESRPVEIAPKAAAAGSPMLVVACLATAAGFASVALSGYPLVAELGLILALGLPACLVTVLLLGTSLLALRPEGRAQPVRLPGLGPGGPVRRFAGKALATPTRAPARTVIAGLLIAACGWVVGTGAESATTVRDLLPARGDAVKEFERTEAITGSSGEVDLLATGRDVTDPTVVSWLDLLRSRILTEAGYLEGRVTECEQARLCPGPSLPDFVPNGGAGLDSEAVRAGLAQLPEAELASILPGWTPAGKPPTATRIPFSVRAPTVSGQQQAIESIQRAVETTAPPDGLEVSVVGLPVTVTDSLDRLAGIRYLIILVAIVAISLVLLLAWRSPARILAPLIPILAAVGWSALVVAALGIPLNPLSAVLAVMVVAIATEFGVILATRYRQERATGSQPGEALASTYRSTGMAVLASGVTAISGFAALAASDVVVLREFGLIAVLDLGVALAGVVVLLPAVLLVAEERR